MCNCSGGTHTELELGRTFRFDCGDPRRHGFYIGDPMNETNNAGEALFFLLATVLVILMVIGLSACNTYNSKIEFKCAGHGGVAAVDGDKIACHDGHRAMWNGEGW